MRGKEAIQPTGKAPFWIPAFAAMTKNVAALSADVLQAEVGSRYRGNDDVIFTVTPAEAGVCAHTGCRFVLREIEGRTGI